MKYAITALLLVAASAHADFSFEHDEHTYKVVATPASWNEARIAASEQRLNGKSGYLAVIDSDAENTAILEAVTAQLTLADLNNTRAPDGGDAAFVWIGASDIVTEGVWLWEQTGEQFWAGNFNGSTINGLYANWGVEPDNLNDQDAAALGLEAWPRDFGDLGIAGQWNDVSTSNALYYIVEFDTPAATFRLSLEEPVAGQTYSGVGNFRGWAVSSEGIDKIEVEIDGEYVFDAPYGGPRGDVGAEFPDIDDADKSGFSLAFSYGSLAAGEHVITVRATDAFGNTEEASSRFQVTTFHSSFVRSADAVDFRTSNFLPVPGGFRVTNAIIDGVVYDLRLRWRPATQGLEIIEINQLTQPESDGE